MVIGTDISHTMISEAISEYEGIHPNLGFLVMDAERNIFFNQFDVITSFCCLHWVKAQLKALFGIKNALAKDGKAILLVPLRHEELYTSIEKTMTSSPWDKYFINFNNPHNFFTFDEYSSLLTEAGLKKQLFKKEIMCYEFDTKRQMELFLKAWLPHMHLIPFAEQNSFLSEVVTRFNNIISSNENNLSMPPTMLQVVALRI